MADRMPCWKAGGILWFSDLSMNDQYFILPFSIGLITYLLINVF